MKCLAAILLLASFNLGECFNDNDHQNYQAQHTCVCPLNYDPVCGSDGKTYPNSCALECETKNNPALTKLHEGPCVENENQDSEIKSEHCICPFILNPVCGSDGKVYDNECLLNCEAKKHPGLHVKNYGICVGSFNFEGKQKPCVCPFLLRPVCGTNGKSYPNPCVLKCEARSTSDLSIKHYGYCTEEDKKSADEHKPVEPLCPCPKILDPVCGTDGKTYSNVCLLKCQAKVNPGLSVMHHGRCNEVSLRSGNAGQNLIPAFCRCPPNFSPLCGTDGKFYPNSCYLACQARRTPGLKIKHFGDCTENDLPQSVEPRKEVCICPRIYLPVCGTDGRVYSNECELNCQAKVTPGLAKKNDGMCNEEAVQRMENDVCICTLEYAPVCGSDGKVYSNKCFLACQARETPGLTKKYDGVCVENVAASFIETPRDPCICTREYRPVCGSDGKVYSNECVLNCAAQNKPGLYKEHDGECSANAVVSPMENQLPCICTNEFNPVCGSDGNNYSNACKLRCEARNKPGLVMKHYGICG